MMETEASINQLEAYLDGALDPAEAAAVAARLEGDSSLRQAMATLRAERALRSATWAALEGTPAEGEAAAVRFVAAARRQQASDRRMRAVRWISAAAAVVGFGFAIGWTGRTLMAPQAAPVPIVQAAPDPADYRVAVTDAQGNVIAVQHFETVDDARRFSRDLHEWQDRQQRLTEGQVLLVGDRF